MDGTGHQVTTGLCMKVRISGLGTYVPPHILTNADLERMVDTSDAWIRRRTGVAERHIAASDQATSDLAVNAVRKVLEEKHLGPDDIDLLIVATITPDMQFPSTACLVQHKLGARNLWGFDLSGACCGFLYAVTTGAQFVHAGVHRRVVVVGADTMSRITNYEDRATCILFGDAAGAVVLEACAEGEGILDFLHEIDGSGGESLKMPAGGSLRPASAETVAANLHTVHQEGAQVFKYAVTKMTDSCQQILARNGISSAEVDLLVPHQANLRIIRATSERLGLPDAKVVINIEKYGNTTAATIPLALQDAIDDGRLGESSLILLAGVGAGFTAGTVLLRWAE